MTTSAPSATPTINRYRWVQIPSTEMRQGDLVKLEIADVWSYWLILEPIKARSHGVNAKSLSLSRSRDDYNFMVLDSAGYPPHMWVLRESE